jgi:glucose-6-phosphate dehydrogenase assembly protein OpcA
LYYTGAQCHVKDLHPTPSCRDCDQNYEAGGLTDCAGYAWVTTNGPGQKYMHMATIVALMDGTLVVAWWGCTS